VKRSAATWKTEKYQRVAGRFFAQKKRAEGTKRPVGHWSAKVEEMPGPSKKEVPKYPQSLRGKGYHSAGVRVIKKPANLEGVNME